MGRPRGFDENKALEAAMRVFWEKSYEGATLSDLTRAMGINRSSLYAAFGDKEALYKQVMTQYREGPMAYMQEALHQPKLREAECLLRGTVDFLARPDHPKGCLAVQGALACGSQAEPIQKATTEWRRRGEAAIKTRLQRAQREDDWTGDLTPADLARYVSSIMAGLAVQAANGATKSEMTRVVNVALKFMHQ